MSSKPHERVLDKPFKTLTVRLPVDLYTQIAALAEKERRTVHSQLLVLIEHALQKGESRESDDSRRR